MILSKEKLFHLNVCTRSGVFLGRICDITFDTHSGSILQYHVRAPRFISRILPFLFKSRILFIAHAQIIQWKEHEIIIEDHAARSLPVIERIPIPAQKSSPATSCSSTDRAAPS